MHLVRGMRSGLPDRRDLRGDAAAAIRTRADSTPREDRAFGLPLLRRRVSGRSARRQQSGRSRHISRYRAEHAQSGLHLREGALRLRFPPTPRPAHSASDPEGMDEGKRPLDLERAEGRRAPCRAMADDRRRGPAHQAGHPAPRDRQERARAAAARAARPGHPRPRRDPRRLVLAFS